jgi:hypothetical protein
MQASERLDRLGALSAAVLAKVGDAANENVPIQPILGKTEQRRSGVAVALWMVFAASAVVVGILTGRSIFSFQ